MLNMVFLLTVLLISVAVSYFIMPNLAPMLLVGAGVVLLAISAYKHWSTFGTMEYERSTWQYNLRQYGSYVMMAAVILGAYGFYAMNKTSGGGGGMMNTSSGGDMTLPGMAGGAFGSVMKTASSRIQELMRRGRITLNN